MRGAAVRAVAIALAAWLAAPRPALAESLPEDPGRLLRDPDPLHAALSVFPGIVVPGLGHDLDGEDGTAARLRWISGASALSLALGGGMLAGFGGNRQLAPAYVPLMFAGGTTFLASWLADVAGTVDPRGFGEPFEWEQSASASLLYGGGWDPYTPVRHLGKARASWESRELLLSAWASLAPGTPYREAHVTAGWKLWSDGQASHLALAVEGIGQSAAIGSTSAWGGAGLLELRFDAGRLGRHLRGFGYVQRLGWGWLRYGYGDGAPADVQGLLVLEAGLTLSLTEEVELGLLYAQRPDTRLGWVVDHGGELEPSLRIRLDRRLRLVFLGHVGAGADLLGGVEATW